MKKLLILFLLSASVLACKKGNISNSFELERSYRVWLAFKNSNYNHYNYEVTTDSYTGLSTKTIIAVSNGKVIQRYYKVTRVPSTMYIPPSEMEWVETENELNKHKTGAATITLDEVYNMAKNEWLLKRDNAIVTFETKNNGMISTCGYRDARCSDDCFKGITITAIFSPPFVYEK